MSIADEIFRALSGGRSRDSAPVGIVLDDLKNVYGSRRAAARATGIPESTLRRWESRGVSPKVRAARGPQLAAAYRRALLDKGTADRWRDNRLRLTVSEPGPKGRGRERTVDGGRLDLAPGTGERVVDKWLAGDDAGAAQAFVGGIREPWYRDVMFGDWLAEDDMADLAYEGEAADDEYQTAVSGMS